MSTTEQQELFESLWKKRSEIQNNIIKLTRSRDHLESMFMKSFRICDDASFTYLDKIANRLPSLFKEFHDLTHQMNVIPHHVYPYADVIDLLELPNLFF